jgi:hypothetical protein
MKPIKRILITFLIMLAAFCIWLVYENEFTTRRIIFFAVLSFALSVTGELTFEPFLKQGFRFLNRFKKNKFNS